MEILKTILPYIPFVLLAILGLIVFISGYVVAGPDEAVIISGPRKKPKILVGKAGLKIPFLERKDKLSLGAIQIDVNTTSAVPTAEYINVNVDSTVSVKIGATPEMISLAAQNFLNYSKVDIAKKINDVLEGNIREIVGQMKLTQMVSDRKVFSEKVQENAVPDLAKFGLELISFNVQNFSDDNGVIENLGIDNVEQIRKDAAIAKSNAQREISVAEAENAKISNDARIAAEENIAERNNALAIKQAELDKAESIKNAETEAAGGIEEQRQRKVLEITKAEANLARQEKEIELQERRVLIEEKKLEASIKKTAEAKKYAAQQESDAELYVAQQSSEAELYRAQKYAEAEYVKTQKSAEAELFDRAKMAEAEQIEAERKAEAEKALAEALKAKGEAEAAALKAKGEAEADAIRAKGEAEAVAIKAKSEAEADGLMKKADALAKYGDAAKQDMQLQAIKVYFEQLPAIAEAVGKGYMSVESIKMFGGDTSQLAGDIMKNMTQISDGLSESIGVDIKSLLAGFIGGKVASDKPAEIPMKK